MPTDATDDPSKASLDNTAIARQAIVDQSGGVFGYELFDRSVTTLPHSAASDAQLLFNVLSHADNGALIDNVIAPNIGIFGWLVWLAEFWVVLSLLLGLFTRLGGLVALGVSLQVYVGLAAIPRP